MTSNHLGKLKEEKGGDSQTMQMCVAPFPMIPGCAKTMIHSISLQGPGREVVQPQLSNQRPAWAQAWTDGLLLSFSY